MTATSFQDWWDFAQEPDHDGQANDTAPGDPFTTRWGFTFPTWVSARRYAGYIDCTLATFNAYTQGQMGALARIYFWQRQRLDQVQAGSDVAMMDWMWTSGRAVEEVQMHLGFRGANVDGLIGPMTLTAINGRGYIAFVPLITTWRKQYYDAIGERAAGNNGLYDRADACETMAMNLGAVG